MCRQTLVECVGIFYSETELNLITRDFNGAWEVTFFDYWIELRRFLCKITGDNAFKLPPIDAFRKVFGRPVSPNTLTWAKAVYYSKAVIPFAVDLSRDADFRVNAHIINTAQALCEKGLAWDDVEPVLQSMIQIVKSKDPMWR